MYGGNVLDHPRHPADVGISTDRDEVVGRGAARDVGLLLHLDVSGEQHVVAHDDPVGEVAVVGHVAAGPSSKTMTFRTRVDPAALDRAAVDGDELADRVLVADRELRRLALVRRGPGAGRRGSPDHDQVVLADPRSGRRDDLGTDPGPIADTTFGPTTEWGPISTSAFDRRPARSRRSMDSGSHAPSLGIGPW